MIDIGSKFIAAEQHLYLREGKPAYNIVNKKTGDKIAEVEWYPAWKKYVFIASGDCVFDTGCLKAIIAFMDTR